MPAAAVAHSLLTTVPAATDLQSEDHHRHTAQRRPPPPHSAQSDHRRHTAHRAKTTTATQRAQSDAERQPPPHSAQSDGLLVLTLQPRTRAQHGRWLRAYAHDVEMMMELELELEPCALDDTDLSPGVPSFAHPVCDLKSPGCINLPLPEVARKDTASEAAAKRLEHRFSWIDGELCPQEWQGDDDKPTTPVGEPAAASFKRWSEPMELVKRRVRARLTAATHTAPPPSNFDLIPEQASSPSTRDGTLPPPLRCSLTGTPLGALTPPCRFDVSEVDDYWQDMLRTADADRDGRISKAEFLLYVLGDEELDASGSFVDKEREAELERVGVDLAAAQDPVFGDSPASKLVASLFDVIDADGSGYLEADEGRRLLCAAGCDVNEIDYYWQDILRAADGNHSASAPPPTTPTTSRESQQGTLAMEPEGVATGCHSPAITPPTPSGESFHKCQQSTLAMGPEILATDDCFSDGLDSTLSIAPPIRGREGQDLESDLTPE